MRRSKNIHANSQERSNAGTNSGKRSRFKIERSNVMNFNKFWLTKHFVELFKDVNCMYSNYCNSDFQFGPG
jgi:hypothetical protein